MFIPDAYWTKYLLLMHISEQKYLSPMQSYVLTCVYDAYSIPHIDKFVQMMHILLENMLRRCIFCTFIFIPDAYWLLTTSCSGIFYDKLIVSDAYYMF